MNKTRINLGTNVSILMFLEVVCSGEKHRASEDFRCPRVILLRFCSIIIECVISFFFFFFFFFFFWFLLCLSQPYIAFIHAKSKNRLNCPKRHF
jgi:hypothetical protein